MDIFNFARAAEQTVYETVSWLYFFPATLFRVIFQPFAMLDYAARQSSEPDDKAFAGAMRPALFLLISIIIGATLVPLEAVEARLLPADLKDTWLHLIAFRLLIFAIFPMVAAIAFDLLTPGEVTRHSLKTPFNQQSYVYGPFALIVSPGMVLVVRDMSPWALGAIAIAHVWLLAVQFAFFRRKVGFSSWKAALSAVLCVVVGWLFSMLLAVAVTAQ